MHLAEVDVQEEGAAGREDAMGLAQPGLEKAQVVVVAVVEGTGGQLDRAIATAAEARAVAALLIAHGAQGRALLLAARVEGRIDVDQLHRAAGHRRQGLQIVGADHLPHRGPNSTSNACGVARGP